MNPRLWSHDAGRGSGGERWIGQASAGLLMVIGLWLMACGAAAQTADEALQRRETVAALAFLSQYGDMLPQPATVADQAERHRARSPREWLAAVQNMTRLRPYAGSLQSPAQVLQSGEANSADFARLLQALLSASGHQARVVSAAVPAPDVKRPQALPQPADASDTTLPPEALKKLESTVAALAPALWKQIEAQPAVKAQWLQKAAPRPGTLFWAQVKEGERWLDLQPEGLGVPEAQTAAAQEVTDAQWQAQAWMIKIAVTQTTAPGSEELLLAHEAAASALHAQAITFLNSPSGSLHTFVPTLLVGPGKIEGKTVVLDPKAKDLTVFRLQVEVRGPDETRRYSRMLAAPSAAAGEYEKGLEAASVARIAIVTSRISDVEYARIISGGLKGATQLLLDPPEDKAPVLVNRAACSALGLLDSSQRLSGSLGPYSRQAQAFQARPAIAIEREFVEVRPNQLVVRRGFDLVDPGHGFTAEQDAVAAQAAVEQGVADALLEQWLADAPVAVTSLRLLDAAVQGNAPWQAGVASAEWRDDNSVAPPQYLMTGDAAARCGLRLEPGPQVVPILSNGTGGTLEDEQATKRLKDICNVLSWSGMLIPMTVMPQAALYQALVKYHCKLAETYNKAANVLNSLFGGGGGGPDADAEKKIKELERDILGLGPQLAADVVGGALMDAGLGLAIRPVIAVGSAIVSPILQKVGRAASGYIANAIGRGVREASDGALQKSMQSGYNYSVAQWARKMRESGWTRAEREAFFRKYGCFVAGTRVLTPRGTRAIETLRAGDEVISWDFALEQARAARVLQVFSTGTVETVTLTLRNGDRIETTPDHRFWSPASGEWLTARELALSDALMSPQGDATAVQAVELRIGTRATFDLQIDATHNYFVGKSGVLAHNADESCLPDAAGGKVSKSDMQKAIDEAYAKLKKIGPEELERATLAKSASIIPSDRWHAGFKAEGKGASLEAIVHDNYRRAGHTGPLPPMHITTADKLEEIMETGVLAHNTTGASWSHTGTLRGGNIAVRVKPESQGVVSFIDSKGGHGNTPQFQRPGSANPSVDIPKEHLEYYNYETDAWVPLTEFSVPPKATWAPPL